SALSALARRGSGSAARSIFGGFVEWYRGERADGVDSFAEPLAAIDHWDLRTVVAVTSTAPKAVSSRDGMLRTAASPFYPAWVAGAEADLAEARAAIRARDIEALGLVAEHSALKMHAAALAARPPPGYWRAGDARLERRVRGPDGRPGRDRRGRRPCRGAGDARREAGAAHRPLARRGHLVGGARPAQRDAGR